ncbi:MAG: HlyD family efflux transporter periplasmic adaptor subunit [Nevskiaceae bacterium]|nr:MAG: HlyD family efflux transporter periplasmic adaptor subunit [Nevskiaceae bacterium]TAM24899.1 MAG: HlyD family efflux transporter periplasmic adaptor subunit [Nevskiaceae bacterium]
MSAHPRRRFAPGSLRPKPRHTGWLAYAPGREEEPLALTPAERQLAELYDGQRSAADILERARLELGMHLDAEALERFAAELAMAGLLQAGREEPLPSPPISDVRGGAYGSQAIPPSTMPGSLAGPGLMGSLLRLVTDRSTLRYKRYRQVPTQPWTRLGAPLIAPLANPFALIGWLAACLLLLYGLWRQRLAVFSDLGNLSGPGMLALNLALGWTLVHLATVSARSAAISRYAGLKPKLGLIRGMFGQPMLYVDSRGPAEAGDRATRTRIVGAGLSAPLVLFTLAALTWFLSRGSANALSPYSLGIGFIALFGLLLRANPLLRLDGYFLLAQWLGIPNLREQAFTASKQRRGTGWSPAQRSLPRPALYLFRALAVGNLLLLLGLMLFPLQALTARYGALGLIPLMVVLGVIVTQSFRNARSGASNLNLGQLQPSPWWRRSKRFWAISLTLLLLAFVPYRYHPSGDFLVLPGDRADVRALTAGDVREVLVQEGETVKAGQVLARIAADESRAQVASGEARLAQLRADLSLAGKGGKLEEVEVARSALDTASKRAEVSAAQAQRVQEAFRRKSVTAQEYDRARGQADVDKKALEEARRRLELVKSPAVSDRIAAIEAQIRDVQAQLVYHRQQFAYTEVKAPIAGVVVSGSLQFARGQFLNRGDLLAVIEDSQERIAEVRISESAIGEIAPGKSARARVWAFPASSFMGEVRRIAPAAEAGPYGKVVRVQVALADPEHRLLPGMTGNAKLQGDWHPAIVVFSRALLRFVFVELWSWIP